MTKPIGPKVTTRLSCFECPACVSESYAVQGDSGHYVFCTASEPRRRVGDTTWNTPEWCPALAPSPTPSPEDWAARLATDLADAPEPFVASPSPSEEPCPGCKGTGCTFAHGQDRDAWPLQTETCNRCGGAGRAPAGGAK